MKGWAGPLLLVGDLVALALVFLIVLGLAGVLVWLAAQPWTWLLAVGLLLAGVAGILQRWPRRPPPASLPPVRLPWERYCDRCATLLQDGRCPYCDGV